MNLSIDTVKIYKITKIFVIAIFLIALKAYNMPATAQMASEKLVNTSDSALTSEIAKIKQEKLAIEAKSKEQEAACYKKFAVSGCLQDVKTEKLVALNDTKRRELEINEQLRLLKEKAVHVKKEKMEASSKAKVPSTDLKPDSSENSDSKSKAESKTESTSASTSAPKSAKTARVAKLRAEKLPADEQQRVNAANKRVADANKKLAAAQKKAQLRAEKQAQSNAQSAGYSKKLQQAEAHKNEVAQKQAVKTKSKSAPLPIPSAAEIAR
jgi:colicin import membrane protein